MATLPISIDPSGAQEGADRFAQIKAKIANDATEIIRKMAELRRSVGDFAGAMALTGESGSSEKIKAYSQEMLRAGQTARSSADSIKEFGNSLRGIPNVNIAKVTQDFAKLRQELKDGPELAETYREKLARLNQPRSLGGAKSPGSFAKPGEFASTRTYIGGLQEAESAFAAKANARATSAFDPAEISLAKFEEQARKTFNALISEEQLSLTELRKLQESLEKPIKFALNRELGEARQSLELLRKEINTFRRDNRPQFAPPSSYSLAALQNASKEFRDLPPRPVFNSGFRRNEPFGLGVEQTASFGAGLGIEKQVELQRSALDSIFSQNAEYKKQFALQDQLNKIEAESLAIAKQRTSQEDKIAALKKAQTVAGTRNAQTGTPIEVRANALRSMFAANEAPNQAARLAEEGKRLAEMYRQANPTMLDRLRAASLSAKEQLAGLGEQAHRTGRHFGMLSRTTLGTWTQLTVGLTGLYAIRRGFVDFVGTISGYEKQMAIVKAVTRATDDEFKALQETARKIGAGGIFSAKESAEGLVELSKAGLSAREAIAALPGTLAFAVNAQMSLGAAADTSAKIIRQFNLDASKASDVIDSLVTVANKTTTTVQNLSSAFKFVGPAAHSLGIDVQTASATLGILAQSGIEASLAGTNLRGILLELAAPSKEATIRLKAMGLAVEDVNPATHGLVEVLRKLHAAQLTVTDSRIIFDKRVAVGAKVLADNVETLDELIGKTRESTGVAKENAELINNTLVGAWSKFKNALQEVFLQLGESGVSGTLRTSIDTVKDYVLYMAGMESKTSGSIEAFRTFNQVVVHATIAVTAFIVAANFSAVTSSLTAFKLALESAALKSFLFLATQPWTAFGIVAVAAIASVTAALVSSRSDRQEYLDWINNLSEANKTLANHADNIQGIQLAFSRAVKREDVAEQKDLIQAEINNLEELRKQLAKTNKPQDLGQLLQIAPTSFKFEKARFEEEVARQVEAEVSRAKKLSKATKWDTYTAAVEKEVRVKLSITPEFAQISPEYAADRLEERIRLLRQGLEKFADKKSPLTTIPLTFDTLTEVANTTRKEQLDLLKQSAAFLVHETDAMQESTSALTASIARRREEIRLRESQQRGLANLAKARDELREHLVGLEQGPNTAEAIDNLKKLEVEYEKLRLAIPTDAEVKAALNNHERQIFLFEEQKKTLKGLTNAYETYQNTQAKRQAGLEKETEVLEALRGSKKERTEAIRLAELHTRAEKEYRAVVSSLRPIKDIKTGSISEMRDAINLGMRNAAVTSLAAKARDEEIASMGKVIHEQELHKRGMKLLGEGYSWLIGKAKDWIKVAQQQAKIQHVTNIAKDIVTDIKAERAALAMTNEEREVAIRLRELERFAIDKTILNYDALVSSIREEAAKLAADKRLDSLADGLSKSFGNAADSVFLATGYISQSIENLVRDIQRQLLQDLFTRPFTEQLKGLFSNLLTGLGWGGGSQPDLPFMLNYSGNAPASAYGNVFTGRGAAAGDMITNLSRIPTNRGMSVVGEQGPESIMPLGRGKDGRLGVHVLSNGDEKTSVSSTTIQKSMKVMVFARDAESFKRTQRQMLRDMKRNS